MSATSFGGSFNLVETDDTYQKGIFNRYLTRNALKSIIPGIKYWPFRPPASHEIQPLIDRIVKKRRDDITKGVNKKDLLQILIDINIADPINFTGKHIRQEMIAFAFVFLP